MKQIKLLSIASVFILFVASCGEPKEDDPPMPVVTLKDTIRPMPIKDPASAKDTIVTPPSEETQNTATNNPRN